MWTDVNETYCGKHFTKYTSIRSLGSIPEINKMLHANYTSI